MNRYVPSTAAAVLLLATSAYAQEPPPLRTAVDGTFAPHAFPNLSGGYEGFNVDLANEIAKRLKRKIVIDAAQFSGLVPALQAGTYDFLAAPDHRDQGARREHAVHRRLSQHRLPVPDQERIAESRRSSKTSRARPFRSTRARPTIPGRASSRARSAGRSNSSAPRPMRCRRCWSGVPMPMSPATPSSPGRSRTTRSSSFPICYSTGLVWAAPLRKDSGELRKTLENASNA